MPPRKRKPVDVHPLDGRKARVCVERQGLSIVVDDVNAVESGIVAAELLNVFRRLGRGYPELREFPETVHGGSPVEVPDEDEYVEERKRRVGFA